MDFNINIWIDDGRLYSQVDFKDKNEFTQYAYYLHSTDENNALIKQMYISQNVFSFELKKSGSYYVQAYIKYKNNKEAGYTKISKFSNIIAYITKYDLEKFENFLQTPVKISQLPPELELYKIDYPYQDFSLIISNKSNNIREKISSYALKNDYKYDNIYCENKIIQIMHTRDSYEIGNEKCIFSGITRTDKELIVGSDIKNINSLDMITDQIGNFYCVAQNKDKIRIFTDYFGISKIFYYKDSDYFIFSNRIHFIIILMGILKIEKKLNYDKIYAYLSSNYPIITMQNFSRELNIKNLYMLPVDTKVDINIKNFRVDFNKTSIYYELSAPLQYDKKIYNKLIKKAAEELKDNARVVLEYNGFDKFLVDVTGGLDSRLVFSVLTHFPEYKDKIVINLGINKDRTNDFNVALKVISKYPLPFSGYSFDEASQKVIKYSDKISLFLGLTSEIMMNYSLPLIRMCSLPGYFGEISSRPFYIRKDYDSPIDDSTLSIDEWIDAFIKRRTRNAFANKQMHNILKDEFTQIPGRNFLEKFENHYLYYRDRIHFDFSKNICKSNCWGILQSKTLFKLKNMTLLNDFKIKLQLDMLYFLNPEIASVEFELEKDNKDRQILNKQNDNIYPICSKYDQSIINQLNSDWLLKPKGYKKIDINDELYSNESIKNIIKFFVKEYNFDKNYAFLFFSLIDNDKYDYKNRLYNKIISLFYEISE